jgi:GT2 family glycosyltransferase
VPVCSIVIPVHNGAALTRQCLDRLVPDVSPDAEIIVVDDGSSDATTDLLRGYGERIRTVRRPVNAGFAAACNAGAGLAASDRLLFLNNDTVGTPGWLERMLDYAERHPEAGVVGAKLLLPDASVQHAGVAIAGGGWPFHIYYGFPADHPAVSMSRRFVAVTAACALIRRDPFEAAGGFDEGFLNGYEDVDLCLRLAEDGYESHLCHEAVLYHLESRSRRSPGDMDLNSELFARRWGARLRRDDVDYYLADGLLEVKHEHQGPAHVSVAPELGSATNGNGDNEVVRVLDRRARQVLELRNRLASVDDVRLRREPGGLGHAADGARNFGHAGTRPQPGLTVVNFMEHKVAPLAVEVSTAEPPRVNLVLGALRVEHFFAGTTTVLQLAAKLAARGARVRLIAVDEPLRLDDATRRELARHHLIGEALERIDLVDCHDRSDSVRVSPADTVIATSWWTAHIAHDLVRKVGRERFLFLIQEYEPLFYPSGSFAAGARRAYELPHVALFSTELLRDFFAERTLGVFAAGALGEAGSLVFRNAMVDVGQLAAATLSRRQPRRLLFYSRPHHTESRNQFELAVLALRRAVAQGAFSGDWEFTGIGGATTETELRLGESAVLRLMPRQSPPRYRAILRAHDVGLALMDSPHPSLVPIEMASAGMPTVTSTFANKDADALQAISPNLIASDPWVDAVADGLAFAGRRVDEVESRLDGARIDWPPQRRPSARNGGGAGHRAAGSRAL